MPDVCRCIVPGGKQAGACRHLASHPASHPTPYQHVSIYACCVFCVQVLNRLAFASTLSHLRRINSPIGREGKLAKPRQLHNRCVCLRKCVIVFEHCTVLPCTLNAVCTACSVEVWSHTASIRGGADPAVLCRAVLCCTVLFRVCVAACGE